MIIDLKNKKEVIEAFYNKKCLISALIKLRTISVNEKYNTLLSDVAQA